MTTIRASTRQLIETSLRHDAIYRGYLANHLPMALVAFDRMGAEPGRLEAWAEQYCRHLEPFRPSPIVDHFSKLVAEHGAQSVLAASVDELAGGIATAAFHGAIRVAYALESGSAPEMAHALAYWKSNLELLGEPVEPRGSESPAEVLAAMSRDPVFAGRRPAGANIAMRTQAAARMPALAPYVARLDPARLDLAGVSAALIRCYCASGDFTILHGVTGCHAFRALAPSLRDPARALRCLWHAVAATCAGCGSPRVEGWGVQGSDALAWPQILERAKRCEDEHDAKFTYTCWREGEHYRDDRYRRAASARVCHALRETATC